MKDTNAVENPCPVMSAIERVPAATPALDLSVSVLSFQLSMMRNRLSLMFLIDEMFETGVL